MILQPVVNIAEICARKGVKNVVLSPGSRCAPLTIAFARHPKLNVRTVSDERAAAFIALGMALTTGKPTVLVCTSGTAALNYAPAVAEAYFQQVPLLILTADRPPEWIDQLDGQTIRQQNVYGQHIKHSYTFPVDFSHPDSVWHSERMDQFEHQNLCLYQLDYTGSMFNVKRYCDREHLHVTKSPDLASLGTHEQNR